MAYQETNNTLNELTLTAEEVVEQRDQQVERARLKKSGALKKIAKKILTKPAGEV